MRNLQNLRIFKSFHNWWRIYLILIKLFILVCKHAKVRGLDVILQIWMRNSNKHTSSSYFAEGPPTMTNLIQSLHVASHVQNSQINIKVKKQIIKPDAAVSVSSRSWYPGQTVITSSTHLLPAVSICWIIRSTLWLREWHYIYVPPLPIPSLYSKSWFLEEGFYFPFTAF